MTVLSLPHSNADVERLFSQVGIVKTKLRNRMRISTLNSILAIKYGLKRHGQCCYQYELPRDVVKKIGSLEAYENEDADEDFIGILGDF